MQYHELRQGERVNIFAEIWLNHQREVNTSVPFAIKPLNPGFYIFDERASLLFFHQHKQTERLFSHELIRLSRIPR